MQPVIFANAQSLFKAALRMCRFGHATTVAAALAGIENGDEQIRRCLQSDAARLSLEPHRGDPLPDGRPEPLSAVWARSYVRAQPAQPGEHWWRTPPAHPFVAAINQATRLTWMLTQSTSLPRQKSGSQWEPHGLGVVNIGVQFITVEYQKRLHRGMPDTFVAVNKRMVQHERKADRARFGFDRGIELLAAKRHLRLGQRRRMAPRSRTPSAPPDWAKTTAPPRMPVTSRERATTLEIGKSGPVGVWANEDDSLSAI